MSRRLLIAGLAAGICAPAGAADRPAAATELPAVHVIGTTPLPGSGVPLEWVPGNVQSATGADIERSNARDLADFLNRNLGSVHINERQGNPFQPDVNYRGYTASPLLGTPQGLSIYLDGVRLNQPFGDVVSWDLIPRSAIANIDLIPGSNPLFGLNTLGGALSIQTKDGRNNPGASITGTYGSYARRNAEFEYGGYNPNGADWFVTGNLYQEAGWRDDSPSTVGQIFSKFGWRSATTDLKLTYAYANNTLYGNGLQEQRFLDRNYASVYTKPDITDNKSHFLNLAALHSITDALVFSGNAYYRNIATATFNGDLNDESLTESVYQPGAAERTALAAAGYPGVPASGLNAANTPFPFLRCIGNVLLNDEPGEKCNGLINRTRTDQENFGLSGQLTLQGMLGGQRNQFTAGAAYDRSRVKFSQSMQLGFLSPDRSVMGLNAFADGVTGGNIDGAPLDNRVDLEGRIRTWSLYATDTLSIQNLWHVTLSGRYNTTTIRNRDHINPGAGVNSLDGDHSFTRFNPAVGVSYTPSKSLNAYAGYNEGSRAPASVELGCANPAQPCRLPNSMAGDPPLDQVVTRTWEAGLRGRLTGGGHWNAGVFRAENDNDILFVAAPGTPQAGFFKNFGKTRRQGLELGMGSRVGSLDLGVNYTYLDATFQSPETVPGDNNSSNSLATASAANNGVEGGTLQILPGNRIPLVPQHMLKANADYRFTAAFSVYLNVIAVGSSYARGNENNAQQPDGTFYLGSGRSGGYAVLNLGSQYRVDPRLMLFGQINNLLDRQYSTASLLGPTGFDNNGNFIARPFANVNAIQHATFYAPGAPRTFWVGLRYSFDKPAAKN